MKKTLTKDEVMARALEVADMILDGKTRTQIADHYGYMSISSVNYLIENHLLFLDRDKYDAVKKIINNHAAQSRIDGGKKNAGKKRGPNPEKLKRARTVADYMIETNCRYADAERHFGLAASSASPLIHGYLKEYDSTKYIELMNVIERRKCPVGSFVAPKISEDVELKFDKGAGYTEHNCKAICYYIINNNVPWKEVADHFELTPVWTKQYIGRCANWFDMKELVDKAKSVALKGHYTGEMLENEDRLWNKVPSNEWWADRREVLVSNGLKISEYLLVNTACITDATNFFGVYRNKIEEALYEMNKVHEEKYCEVMDMLNENYPKRTKNTEESSADEEPKDYKNTTTHAIASPSFSPIMVSEPIKVAAEVEAPIVKDSEIPVVQKVSDVKVEMVSEPTVQNVSEPEAKPTFFQRVKKFFLGA